MPRKGNRSTVTRGVYKDSGGFEVRIVVGGQPYSSRMPLDSTLNELKAKRAELAKQGHTDTPLPERGTLKHAVPTYLRLVAHLASVDDLEDHLNAWCDEIGHVQRHRITDRDVLATRNLWLARKLSPKTVNNRVGTLRNLYRRLDGKRARTPCDEVEPLPVPKTPIQRVSDAAILAVDAELQKHEAAGTLRNAKTRARFRVLCSTGKRPIELMRALPLDVNIEARVWVPRDAKGGYCAGVYLNDEQRAAWELFIAADAWGSFNLGAFARTIRSCGWPAKVRPYQARHSTWMAASERGVDLADIAAGAGHTDARLTRRMYVPVLNSRLQRLGEALDGRFQGWPVVPISAPDQNPTPMRRKR